MMNKCYFILVILLASLSPYRASIAQAQSPNKQISGIVTSEVGTPVEGVTVRVKGSDRATSTNVEGRYSLELPATGGNTLTFTSTGYAVQEIPIENRTTINVTLSTDVHGMDEVVVVGYGSMRKKDLTGAVTQIRPDNIANENPRTVQDILRGTPGVRVGFDPSAKGGGGLQIRGQRSVYDEGGHNSPLLILDGMIYYGELSEINPDDIEQIDILKDASAAAVYGAQAASGVIIITTKKGKPGKPIVNLRTNVGASTLSTFREPFDEAGYLRHREDWFTKNTYGVNPSTGAYEAYQTGLFAQQPGFFVRPDRLPAGVSADTWRAYTSNVDGESDMAIWGRRLGFTGNALQNFLDGNFTDWSKHVFRTGLDQDYNASVSGAGDRVNYYLSMGYMKNQGVVVSDNYRAVRANMKIDAKVTKWFELGANVNFQNRSDGNVDIDQAQALRNSPYGDYADTDGNPVQFPLGPEFSQRGYNYDFVKQFLELEKGFTTLNSILQARVKLPFNINYSFNASPRFQFFHDRYFMSAALPGSDPKSRGVNRSQAQRFDWSINNVVSWEKEFNDKHRINATFVYEAEERQFWEDMINARNILPSDALGFHNTRNGMKEDSSYSSFDTRQTADGMLGRLFYSYDDRYQLTTSLRRDGYSGFGTSNPHAIFPSAAVAWNFTNESFFNPQGLISNGKLRLSYGENGNRSLADPNLALANLYEGAGKMQGYINSAGELALYRYLMADRLANPFLQWEKTASYNVGLEFSLFNNRISTTMEYYSMSTKDMIMQQRLPSFTGFERIATNLGQVDNRGFELTLNTLNIQRENFQWSTNFGMSYNKNRIKHLYYQYEDVIAPDGSILSRREVDDIPNGWFIDQPIDAIWNYRVTGIWQANEVEEAARYGQLPGDPKVANNYTEDDVINADGTSKPVYNDQDKEFLGRRVAPFQWSLRSDFTLWKDLTFSFNLYAYTGHKSLNGNYLNNDDNGGHMAYGLSNREWKEYWTPDNPTNEFGRIEAGGPVGAGGVNKLYNRSFVRLENITVGYTLPRHWTSNLDLNSIKLFGAVRNVATWSPGWPYGDPETGGWAPRLYTFGLNLVF
ncbi:SusC/RagA family TonB-linked outer membrane protein [Sphingobacterium corticibacter]|uniref:SusC/RagA family protein n=1 Tax=Sphingobacterium corticibacter TaxID=2171749 RepID=A0A2T8HJX9_9SPHI|nr:SusC/RagA family TonB-linked outer membrane protein [Sphingobacterium corticibacter]PVH25758.1 SusC/RagA family protein [Sphingobacterium corticibacter]